MLGTEFSPWPDYSDEEAAAVLATVKSNRVNYWTGTQCREFEAGFAQYTDCSHAISLANGTLAIDVALRALEVGPGDEVVVTPRSFIASVSSVILLGATPVFADVNRDSQNLTAETIQAVITPKTKAILLVHLAGYPAEMDDIMDLANEYGVSVIEDCAQAHGAKYKGRSVGTIGHIGTWSFCQDKIITTGGEGGMITTNDEKLWHKMWSFKDHGKNWDSVYKNDHSAGFRWLHDSVGTNYRMMEMQAAIGNVQLQNVNQWTDKRVQHAEKIWAAARQICSLRVPEVPLHVDHAAYRAYVFVKPEQLKCGWNRDRIVAEINALGVPVNTGSCAEIYLEKAFVNSSSKPSIRLPVAKELGETSIAFLCHPTLTNAEIKKTCDALLDVVRQATIELVNKQITA